MKLAQFYIPDLGGRVGIVDDQVVWDLTSLEPGINTLLALLKTAQESFLTLAEQASIIYQRGTADSYSYSELDRPAEGDQPSLLMPINPPEVWAFGVTYRRSALERDKDAGTGKGIYDRAYAAKRPGCFFKATASRCAGPHESVCIRSDSSLTAAEPELAYLLGYEQKIIGYTVCNNVSAWDLERENPLYLPQSRIYSGCCALGPVLVTADEMTQPNNLDITYRIVRQGSVIFEDYTTTSKMSRSLDELTHYLCLHNPVPPGSLVSTGTGITVPNEHHLIEGDTVEIKIEGIGTLVNPVRQL